MHKFYLVTGIKKFSVLIRCFALLLFCLYINEGWGQTTVTLGGEGTITCPATSTATYTTPPAGVTFSNLTRGSGVTCASASDGISGSMFNTANAAASFTANKYYTVTISANTTTSFTLNSLTWLTAISSGSANFTIQYSNNGGALTTFGAAAQTGTSSNNFTGSVNVAAGTSIVIYAIPVETLATGTVRFKNGSTFNITAIGTNSITLFSSPQNFGPFCNSVANAVSLKYNTTGTVTSPFLQLSNSSGSFSSGTSNIGSTITGTGPYTISGSIAASIAIGTYRIRVVSTDATPVISADNGSNIIINAPPSVTVDPSNASVFAPSTATFTVTATNAASYQWQVNTGSGFNNITGATSATYTTPSTTVAMSGYQYQVIVLGGACGNVTSAPAILTVNTTASMWSNPITGTNPNLLNPYTTGQIVDANLTVSGIGRGTGITGNTANDRYNANSWNTATIDLTAYFTFTLTPAAGYKIDFVNFVYTSQASGTGPTNFSIRSSLDGFTADLATPGKTGTTLDLSGIAFQNISSAITFRVYAWGASAATGTFSVDDFTFNGTVSTSCPPTKLIFTNTFTSVNQDAVLSSFPVSIACASNTIITSCSSGTIKLSSTGCGLKGTLTKNVINGVATFDDIYFDRSVQNNITITATYTGSCGTYTDAVSNIFNVNLGGGPPIITSLKNENFSGSLPAWGYTIGTPFYTNVGPEGGTDVTGIKNFSGNNVMAKSFSQDNSSSKKEQGSTDTVAFDNVTGLATYTSVKFSFQIGSIPVGAIGSGAGADNGEYLYIECSLNGGITWRKLLTNNGYSDHSFNLSAASPVSLPYNANVIYSSGDNLWNQSAFEVILPSGTTDFMFRMVANDNRTNENWVIDNIKLDGTTYGAATQKPLPIASASDIYSCPGSNNTISVGVNNGVGTLTYLWTPNTNISNTTISNPVVSPLVTTKYFVTATDADKCVAKDSVLVTVPSGAPGTWTGLVNKDYFNCLNWDNGVVPDPTMDVTINSTLNPVEIDATSPFAGGFGNTASANNLMISNNNINFILGTEKLSLTNLSINTGANINMTNGGTINLSGIWSNSIGAPGFTSGIGTVNYLGTVTQTIAPENYYNLTSSSTGPRTIPGSGIVGVSNIFNAGTNSFTLVTGSTVDFNGAIAQGVPAFDYYNLNISNNDIKTIAGNSSVSGTLKVNNAASLALGARYLTLKSTVTGTAIVAPVTTTASTPISYTSGKFVIERYYPARRSWRLITAPVSTTRTIYNEWQVGGVDYMAAPNSGTFITSPIITDPGLDLSVHYSMKKFDQSTGNLVNIANTKVPISGNLQLPDVPDNIGYFVFVRGDRKLSLLNPYPITNARITTLRDTGVLQTGRKIFNALDTGFMLIGNPYASPVDFGSLGRSGVQRKFYAWDPRLNSYLGAYVVVDGLTPPGYIVSPSPDPMIGTTGQDSIIQSSQAIFVHANTATASVTFNETSKATEDNNTVFRPAATKESNGVYSSLRTNLYLSDSDSAILADGVYNQFNKSFSTSVDSLDAVKFSNFLENFGIVQNGKTLALERRSPVNSSDTIFFKLWNTTERRYELRFSAKGLNNDGLEGYLVDSYLNTRTPVNLNGYTNVSFSVTGDEASKAPNRFMVVFKSAASAPLPVTFSLLKAYQQDKNINVEWKVNNEIFIKDYEIERSLDGQEFTIGSIVNPTKNNNSDVNYLWPDEDVTVGTYYYRIKSIGTNGEIKYSNTVKVTISTALSIITIYPNPVINGNINIHFINQPAGTYYLKLINSLGQNIYSKQVEHLEGSSIEILRPGKKMSHGTYQLEIMKPDKISNTFKVLY